MSKKSTHFNLISRVSTEICGKAFTRVISLVLCLCMVLSMTGMGLRFEESKDSTVPGVAEEVNGEENSTVVEETVPLVNEPIQGDTVPPSEEQIPPDMQPSTENQAIQNDQSLTDTPPQSDTILYPEENNSSEDTIVNDTPMAIASGDYPGAHSIYYPSKENPLYYYAEPFYVYNRSNLKDTYREQDASAIQQGGSKAYYVGFEIYSKSSVTLQSIQTTADKLKGHISYYKASSGQFWTAKGDGIYVVTSPGTARDVDYHRQTREKTNDKDGRGSTGSGANQTSTYQYYREVLPSGSQNGLGGVRENLGNNGIVYLKPGKITQIEAEPHKTEKSPGDGLKVSVGSTIVYEIEWVNFKSTNAAVNIHDTLDKGLDFVSASNGGTYDEATRTVKWFIGNMSAGAKGKVTLTVKVNDKAGAEVTNQATILVGKGDGIEEKKTEIVKNPLIAEGEPHKTETRPGNGQKVSIGSTIVYEIEWVNNRTGTMAINIHDVLDKGVDYVSADFTGSASYPGQKVEYVDSTRTVKWFVGNVPTGAKGKVRLTVRVNDNAAIKVDNQARVGVGSQWTDTEIMSNPLSNGEPHKTEKSPGDGMQVAVGDIIVYEIEWENYKTMVAAVNIADTLDRGLDYVSADFTGSKKYPKQWDTPKYDDATRTVKWFLGNVDPGEKGKVTLTVKVNSKASMKVDNQAKVKVGTDATKDTEIVSNPLLSGGGLIVKKTVQADSDADRSLMFDFTAKFVDSDGNPVTSVGSGGIVNFKLGDGDQWEFSDLPGGTKYTVTEQAPGGKWDEVGGGYVRTGTIVDSDTAIEEFINKKASPEPAIVSLTGRKDLRPVESVVYSFDDARADGDFNFTISPSPSNPSDDPFGSSPRTVQNDSSGNITFFSGLSYSNAGVYKYTVSEVLGSKPGMIYSGSVYDVTVTIALGADGDLHGSISIYDSTSDFSASEILFTNEYNPKVRVYLDGTKLLTGDPHTLQNGEFKFVVQPMPNNPEQDPFKGQKRVVTNDASGHIVFIDDDYWAPAGKYYYSIYELTDTSTPGMIYDGAIYMVCIETRFDQRNPYFLATITGGTGDGAQDSIKFVNSYQPGSTTVYVEGEKHLSGGTLLENMFEFNISAVKGYLNAEWDAENNKLKSHALSDSESTPDGPAMEDVPPQTNTVAPQPSETTNPLPAETTNPVPTTVPSPDATTEPIPEVPVEPVPPVSTGGPDESVTTPNVAPDTIPSTPNEDVVVPNEPSVDEFDKPASNDTLANQDNPSTISLDVPTATSLDIPENVNVTSGEIQTISAISNEILPKTSSEDQSSQSSAVSAGGIEGPEAFDESYGITSQTQTPEPTQEVQIPDVAPQETLTPDNDQTQPPVPDYQSDQAPVPPANNDNADIAEADDEDGNAEIEIPAAQVPMPTQTKVRNSRGGLFRFGPIVYNQAGVYVYHVAETNESKAGYTYDTTVYTVYVAVSRAADGSLTADVVYIEKQDGTAAHDIVFTNPIDPPHITLKKEQAVNKGERTTEKLDVQESDVVTYYVTVTNTGVAEAYGIEIVDQLPLGLYPIESTVSDDGKWNYASTGTIITWKLASLAGGASKTFTFDVTVPHVEEHTEWPNFATATYDNPPIPDDPPIKSPPVTVVADPGTLTITKKVTGDAGDIRKEFTFTLNFTDAHGQPYSKTLHYDYRDNSGLGIAKPSSGTIQNGSLTFNLRHNLSLFFTDIPADVSWSIAENDYSGEGYVTTFTNNNATGKMQKGQSVEVVVENRKDPPPPPDAPNLAIVKYQSLNGAAETTSKLVAKSGDVITYYIDVSNINGGQAAQNVTVTDQVPEGLKLVPGSITMGGKQKDGLITWKIGTIEVGQTVRVSFKVTLPTIKSYTKWQNVAATAYDNPPDNVPPPTSNTVEVESNISSLTVTKTVTGSNANEDDEFTFTLSIYNPDKSVFRGDIFYSYSNLRRTSGIFETIVALFSTKDTEGVIHSGEEFTLKHGETITFTGIPAGSSYTVNEIPYPGYTVSMENGSGTLNGGETASVTVVNDTDTPPTPTPSPTPTPTPTPESHAILELQKLQALNGGEKTKNRIRGNPGDKITYYIEVSNTSSTDAKDVVITDRVPDGQLLDSSSISEGGTERDGVITWNLGTITAGDTVSLEFSVTLPTVNRYTEWKNVAEATYSNAPKPGDPDFPIDPGDPNYPTDPEEPYTPHSNEVVNETLPDAGAPHIRLEKEQSINDGGRTRDTQIVDGGDIVTYYIKATNDGTGEAPDVVIYDEIPEGLVLVPGSISDGGVLRGNTIVWAIGKLAVGASKEVNFKVQIPGNSDKNHWVNISIADYPPKTPDPTPIPEEGPYKTEVTPGDGVSVVEGQQIVYSIHWENTDDDTATITIRDTLDTGVDFVSASDNGIYDAASRTVTWSLGNKSAHEKGDVTLTVVVNNTAVNNDKVQNQAGVQVGNNPEVKTNVVENPVPKDPPPDPPSTSNKVEVDQGKPHIRLEKEQSINGGERTKETRTVVDGDIVTYYIKATSDGTGTASDVVIYDDIPDGLTLIPDSISDGGVLRGNTIVWTVGKLAVGASKEVSFKVQVPENSDRSHWENISVADYPPKPPEIPVIPEEGPYKTEVSPGNGVSVVEGQQIVYSIHWENTSEEVATITIKDTLDPGVDFISASDNVSNNATYDSTSRTVTWILSNRAPHETGDVTLTVVVNDTAVNNSKVQNQAGVQVGNSPEVRTNIVENPVPKDPPVDPPSTSNKVEVEEGNPNVVLEKEQAINDGVRTKATQKVAGGDIVTYYIKATNTGAGKASDVVIYDDIPDGLTLVPGSISDGGVLRGNTIVWAIGRLAAGASKEVSFKVQVPEGSGKNHWENISIADYPPKTPDPTPIPEEGPYKTEVTPGNGVSVVEGQQIVYSIHWENTDDTTATITIRDTLDTGVDFVSASDNGTYDAASRTVTWTLGDKLSHEEGDVTLTVVVNNTAVDNGKVQNQAGVQVGNNPEVKTNVVENPVPKDPPTDPPSTSNKVETEKGTPNIELEKAQAVNGGARTSKRFTVNTGDVVTYYVIVKNTGDGTAPNLVIYDDIPEGLQLVPGSISDGGVNRNNTIIWVLNDVAPGDTVELSFKVTIPSVSQNTVWKNVAIADEPDVTPPPIPEEGPYKTEVTPGAGQYVLEGQQIVYSIHWENTTGESAEVTIRDTLDSGVDFVSASTNGMYDPATRTVTWNLGPQENNSEGDVTLTVVVNDSVVSDFLVENQAGVKIGNNPEVKTNTIENPVPNEPPENPPHVSNKVEVEEGPPTLVVKKEQAVNGGTRTTDKMHVEAGNVVTYYITVTNTSTTTAKNVVVYDDVPEGLYLVAGSISNGGVLHGKTVTWTISTVEANSSVEVSFQVMVPEVSKNTDWGNVAVVDYNNTPDNPGTTPPPTIPDEGPYKTEVTPGDGFYVLEGQQIVYSIHWENGENTSAAIVITDTLDGGLDYVSSSNGGSYNETTRTVTWNLGEMPAKSSGDVTLTVVVNETALDRHLVQNQAGVQVGNKPVVLTNVVENPIPNTPPTNPPITTNKVEVEEGIPHLTVRKEQSRNDSNRTTDYLQVEANDAVTYYLTITNDGTETATDVVLTDTIPAGLTLVEGSISNDGMLAEDGVTVRWQLGNVAIGESRMVTFTVNVPAVETSTTWQNIGRVKYSRPDPDIPTWPNNPDDPSNPNIPGVPSDDTNTRDPDDHSIVEESNVVEIGEGTPHVSIKKSQSINEEKATTDKRPVKGHDIITYYITVTSDGLTAATNVKIRDVIPSGLRLVKDSITDGGVLDDDATTVRWEIEKMEVGETKTVSFKVLVPMLSKDTSWKNIAYVTHDNNNPDDPDNPETPSNTVTVEQKMPNISIKKEQSEGDSSPTSNDLEVKSGSIVTYHLTITNSGEGIAQEVLVRDEIPSGLTLIDGSISDNGSLEDDGVTIRWNIGEIAAGRSKTVSFQVKVPSVKQATDWTNIAYVSFNPPDPIDPDYPVYDPNNPNDPANRPDPDVTRDWIPSNEVVIHVPGTPPKTADNNMFLMLMCFAGMLLSATGAAFAHLMVIKKRRNF